MRLDPIVAALLAVSAAALAAPQQLGQVEPLEFGEPFPPLSLDNLNAGVGGPPVVDLSRVLGKRPVVLCYWIPGNYRADQVFQELQALADDIGPERLVLLGVTAVERGIRPEEVATRARELKIRVPVLRDRDFRIAQSLNVRSVPSITILDAAGRLRLANGASLKQPLEYKVTLADALRRVAETGELATYGALGRWYPVRELVGEKCPDFQAPLLDGSRKRWSEMLAADKLNVLVFWSVECPHCRQALPPLSRWLKEHGQGINLVGAADVPNEAVRVKTEEFCRANGLSFPVFLDEGLNIAKQFRIVSTPTFVIVRPDGTVDSVILSGEEGLEAKLEAKRRELLGAKG